jgi:hypothetical protein
LVMRSNSMSSNPSSGRELDIRAPSQPKLNDWRISTTKTNKTRYTQVVYNK